MQVENEKANIPEQVDCLTAVAGVEEARSAVLDATRDFKSSWRNLAKALQVVWKQKHYLHWGYETFDQYTAKEVNIRKHTAMKLIRSYVFLKKEGDLYLQNESDADHKKEEPLSLETINTLQKAKKNLNDQEYQKIKKDLVDDGKDPREVKKDLIGLMSKQRKALDPEKERVRSANFAIHRFLAVLRSFKREIDTLQILPGVIAEEIDRLVKKIEQHPLG